MATKRNGKHKKESSTRSMELSLLDVLSAKLAERHELRGFAYHASKLIKLSGLWQHAL